MELDDDVVIKSDTDSTQRENCIKMTQSLILFNLLLHSFNNFLDYLLC